MTLRRGQTWGDSVEPPTGLIEIDSDANAAIHAGIDRLPVRLTGGDLLASLGGPSHGSLVNRFAVDLLRVRLLGEEAVALAHVVARGRTWWRGPVHAAFNTDRMGRWDAAPRAHPGDRQLDVVEVDGALSVRQRWQAWRRLPTGTHVPHPLIEVRRAPVVSWSFGEARHVWVDGVDRGAADTLQIAIEPDAVIVYT